MKMLMNLETYGALDRVTMWQLCDSHWISVSCIRKHWSPDILAALGNTGQPGKCCFLVIVRVFPSAPPVNAFSYIPRVNIQEEAGGIKPRDGVVDGRHEVMLIWVRE